MNRADYPVRKTSLEESRDFSRVRDLSPSERVAMVWQLTLQAWMFKEGQTHEPRLRRDVVRTRRSSG
jgi:hypothetical protein